MKYFRIFDSTSAYTEYMASSSAVMPNIAYCSGDNKTYITASETPTYEYVDLGLPSGTKWATMNVGALSETEAGNYYRYGKGVETYQETSGQSSYYGTEKPLATSADTAAQVWGGKWHTPTSAQCQELVDYTEKVYVENYNGTGKNGWEFTANGKTLFLPCVGHYNNGIASDTPNFYMSSTPKSSQTLYGIYLNSSSVTVSGNIIMRGYGCPVRPVMDRE